MAQRSIFFQEMLIHAPTYFLGMLIYALFFRGVLTSILAFDQEKSGKFSKKMVKMEKGKNRALIG